jgi:hypothetical protein
MKNKNPIHHLSTTKEQLISRKAKNDEPIKKTY